MVFEGMTSGGHERIVFVNEPQVGLRAIIAIHSTALGPALGGVRRWHYRDESAALDDVLRLSEAMTYKNAAAGLPLGGGKSVILLDRPDRTRTPDEARAMGDAVRGCAGRYIAAEDVGINEEFVDFMAEKCEFVTGGVRLAPGGDPAVWTAQTVVNGMRASLRFVDHRDSPTFENVSVNLIGLGSVGMNIVRFLREAGATLRGFDINAERMAMARDEFGVEVLDDANSMYDTPCDIFAPCALGGIINDETVNRIKARIVCGAANNPLQDPEKHAHALAKRGITYTPDFIINAGGVIQLGCAWFKWSDSRREQMIAGVEDTTLTILKDARARGITSHAAARAFAESKITHGSKTAQAPG